LQIAALEMRGITKRFPEGVVANDGVSLQVARGEIHALLGENGAGKTTLMNILYGLYRPDEGEILVGGRAVCPRSPSDAMHHGIGMVHQHFRLVPVMTVTENIVLGKEIGHGPFLDRKGAAQRIYDLSRQYRLDVDPEALVEDLPVGMRQRVEILKALYRRADILILDEPTAVLTPSESKDVFDIITALAQQGTAIIFITHKLKEVWQVAHRITVMRGGRVVGTTTPAETTEAQLATLMVGHETPQPVAATRHQISPAVILQVRHLQVLNDRGTVAVDDVSLAVRAGEILGIAGVQGNGQTELVEVLTGLRSARSGQISIGEVDVTHATPRRITMLGVAHIPEDRHRHGMVDRYSIADNLVLNVYHQRPFASSGIIRHPRAIAEHAIHAMQTFDIRAPSHATSAGSLSGGNQQKMVAARELGRPLRLLIATQPTRGLDVGAIAFLHQQLVTKRDAGCAVLLVSAELDEILALSDRIAVMYRGKFLATVEAQVASRESLGRLMAGLDSSLT